MNNVEESLGPTSDYTRIAPLYDATREVPADRLTTCYERSRALGILPDTGLILDAGAGTGQMSLPLADMGYEVVGYDYSAAMVEIANGKVRGRNAVYKVADVRRLPEPDGRFDAVVIGKLFQHVGNWQMGVREVVRVLKPGCCLLLIDERGAFRSPVREHLAKLIDAAGFAQRLPGTRDPRELAAYILSQGCEHSQVDVSDLGWEKQVSNGESLDQLKAGIFTEFQSVPADVYKRLLAETASWVDSQPGGRAAAGIMRPYLTLEVFRKIRA